MPTDLDAAVAARKRAAQAQTQTLVTIVLVWVIICLDMLGLAIGRQGDGNHRRARFKHAPHHAARRLSETALLGRIWGFFEYRQTAGAVAKGIAPNQHA